MRSEHYRPYNPEDSVNNVILDAHEWLDFWGQWRPKLESVWGEERTREYITNMDRFKREANMDQKQFLDRLESDILGPFFDEGETPTKP